MTKNFYTEKYEDHTTFGGIICESDFNTEYRSKDLSVAARIVSDWNFDKQCKKNRENTIRQKQYKKGLTA